MLFFYPKNNIKYFYIDLFKIKLSSEIKNINKTKNEYENELNDMLWSNRKMVSEINIQFEKIQRLMGKL